jgi:hypothetical protein
LIDYATGAAYVLALVAFVATLMFVAEATRNPNIHPLKRLAWTLAIVVGSPFALPLYWAWHIRGRS